MFALLKSKNPYEQNARAVYAKALEHIRKPQFYTAFGVPDTFDGRFDVLLVHVFMVMEAVGYGNPKADDFNQALFDVTFADMDQTMREMGIGDMGIPKHMRKMMKAFNGRMHAYQGAFKDGGLEEALRRNLYGTIDTVDAGTVEKFSSYFKDNMGVLKALGFDALVSGAFEFKF